MGLLVPTGKFFPNNKPLDVSSSKTEREGKMCVMRRGAGGWREPDLVRCLEISDYVRKDSGDKRKGSSNRKHLQVCISLFQLLKQNTPEWVAYKQP